MRDGVSTGEKDTADLDALAADNRLIRRVRWQLYASGALLPGPDAIIAGGTFDDYLASYTNSSAV